MLKKWFGRKREPGAETPEEQGKTSAWAAFRRGLTKTRKGLTSLFSFRGKLDDAFVEGLESELYAADFGPAMVDELIHGAQGVREAWKERKIETPDQVREYIGEHLRDLLRRRDSRLLVATEKPSVILVAGVNGTGKTTSIAKLAYHLKEQGNTVLLAAADTFRAAAVEQLTIWSERLEIGIVTGDSSADPASVAYRGAEKVIQDGLDFLIVDTAGRLHTQANLMRELQKIRNVLERKIPGAPHECLLVLDATTGQNALSQARSFLEAIRVTGIVLAKLDGTARGGIVVTINNQLEIPVKFVGVGEQLEDLQAFDPEHFVQALLED